MNKRDETNWDISFVLFIFWLFETSFDLRSLYGEIYLENILNSF